MSLSIAKGHVEWSNAGCGYGCSDEKQMTRRILLASGTIAAIIILFYGAILVPWFIEGLFRYGIRYEIQEGFNGWAIIQYGDARCPPLETQNRYFVIKIPNSGCVCTGTPSLEGPRTNRFEYVSPNGNRQVIPSKLEILSLRYWSMSPRASISCVKSSLLELSPKRSRPLSYLRLLCIIAQNRIETLREKLRYLL